MKIKYKSHRFNSSTRATLTICESILADYQSQGYDLTLRQLYYRLVAGGYIPNTNRDYKRLGKIVSDGRLAGILDWDTIVDRTRGMKSLQHWSDAESIVSVLSKSYKEDTWANQSYRPEVWVEKDALVGVIGRVCNRWDVPYFSCRGYPSQSSMWRAGNRLVRNQMREQVPVIIHLSDHDPSGIDMARDIRDRMTVFRAGFPGEDFDFDRIALTMAQVEKYDPPPNPAKVTDSRYEGYVVEYGMSSWELDALEPSVLESLIEGTINRFRDEALWKEAKEKEAETVVLLENLYNRFDEVREIL